MSVQLEIFATNEFKSRHHVFATRQQAAEAARLRNTYSILTWNAIAIFMGETYGVWKSGPSWVDTIQRFGIYVQKRPRGNSYKSQHLKSV